jgi:polyhydroxyalkanoate synthesis regulator phasin
MKITLQEHYQLKVKRFNKDSNFFAPCFKNKGSFKAANFLKEKEQEICKELVLSCNLPQYRIKKLVNNIIKECQKGSYSIETPLDLKNSPFLKVLSRRTIKYIDQGNDRIIM